MPEQLPRVFLIRHGETEWSKLGRHTGRTDLPLSADGQTQARGLAKRFGDDKFDRVFSSPLRRAHQTCVLSGIAAAPEIDVDLVEWDYGRYEGIRTAEIRAQQPDWNLFRDGCPGGEMPADISARADRIISRLKACTGKVAVFSHGHFIRVLAARWIGLDILEAQHFLLGTAAVSILAFEHGSADEPVIALWNSTPDGQ